MRSLGATHLLVLLALVVLVLDSRRLHTLVGAAVRGRRGVGRVPDLPSGTNGEKVGLPLRQIQMRHHVDWQDGGIGWDGPEVLPADDAGQGLVDRSNDLFRNEPETTAGYGDVPADAGDAAPTEPSRWLPVLWKPFPAFLVVADDWPPAETPATGTAASWSAIDRAACSSTR